MTVFIYTLERNIDYDFHLDNNKNMREKMEDSKELKEFKNLLTDTTWPVAKQVLLTFVDVFRITIPLFDKANVYRIPFKQYDRFRENNKIRFRQEIYRLQKKRFVKKYFDGKNYYLELLPKGEQRIKELMFEDLDVSKPKKWDRKWRLVSYDIPDSKKKEREMIKRKLELLGFYKLQESLYIFPFDCLNEIQFLKESFFLGPYIQYLIVERAETEIDLIHVFYDRGILTTKML